MRTTCCVLVGFLISANSAVAAKQPAPLSDSAFPFSADEVAWAAVGGQNTIVGHAVLRTVGGDAKTCAGLPAQLVPFSRYGEERIKIRYGSTEKGYFDARTARPMQPPKREYEQIIRATICDANGQFKFTNLADGIYFLNSQVTWGVPTRYFTRIEGGGMMLRVEVKGGETKEVILTNY